MTARPWCGATSRPARRCRYIPRRWRSPVTTSFYDIDVLAAYRPTGKGRVERQVTIVRDHVLAGRSFSSAGELRQHIPGLGAGPPPHHHRTHGEVIGVRAQRDHARIAAAPGQAVCGRGPAPAAGREGLPGRVRGQLVLGPGEGCSTGSWSRSAPRPPPSACTPPCQTSTASRSWPCTRGRSAAAPASSTQGTGRRCPTGTHARPPPAARSSPLVAGTATTRPAAGRQGRCGSCCARADAAQVTVGHRPLSIYDQVTRTRPFTTVPATDPKDSA